LIRVQLSDHARAGDHVGERVGLAFYVEAGLLRADLEMKADDPVAAVGCRLCQAHLGEKADVDSSFFRVRGTYRG
jgi:hypothetical protein